MPSESKPMTLSDIFDRTFKLIGKTLSRNVIIALIVIIPVSLIFALAMQEFFSALGNLLREKSFTTFPSFEDLSPLFMAGFIYILGIIFYFLIDIFASVAIMFVVGCEMNQKPMTWYDAMRVTFKEKFLTAVGQTILASLAIGALFLVPYVILIAGLAMREAVIAVIGGLSFIAAYFFAIYLMINWLFALPVIAWENAGVIESFRRSRYIVKDHWWRTLGIMILLSIVASFAVSIITTPVAFIALWGFISKYFSLLSSMESNTFQPEQLFEIFSSIGFGYGIVIGISAVIQMLITPVYYVVMYFDLRARKGEFGPKTTEDPSIPYGLVPPTS